MRSRIVFIIDEPFPYISGGTRTWVFELSKRLARIYDVSIVSLKRWKGYAKVIHPVQKTIKVYGIPTLFNLPMGNRFHLIKHLFGGIFLFSFFSSLFVFSKYYFSTGKIVFVTINPGQTFLPTLVCRKKSAYSICAVKGPYVEEMTKMFPHFRFLFIFLQKISFRFSDLIILNGFDTEKLLKSSIKDVSKIKILPNGVDFLRFSNKKKRIDKSRFKKIILLGTLSEERGTHYLIESIPSIKEMYPDYFMISFVGRGNASKYLALAKKLGVDDYVEFLGEHSEEIPSILSEFDIAVALTKGIGISHSLLEEMASGKAIVAWDIHTYSQILKHDYSGYLVKAWDSKALGYGLAHLLKNDDLIKKLGTNAQKEAKKFDWENITKQFIDYLKDMNKIRHEVD